jgi:hypothetical protein
MKTGIEFKNAAARQSSCLSASLMHDAERILDVSMKH